MDPAVSHIFVSYSRVDESLVTPIVHVMRAIGVGVFQDIDSIPYGKRWRPVIEKTIDQAQVVLVFWCEHSQKSDEVRNEWRRAVQADKDVVPALLDDTPLDAELAEFQAVDLRSLGPSHPTYRSTKGTELKSPLRNSLKAIQWWLEKTFTRYRVGQPRHDQLLKADAAATAAARLLSFLRHKATDEMQRQER